jgi:pimeloyl-ACP methyl ester carboxylesterase
MRSFGPDQPPFDVTALKVPAVFGTGGADTAPYHREGVMWLASHVPGASLFEIATARHGAHLSHPDHFATMTRAVLERAVARESLSHGPQ